MKLISNATRETSLHPICLLSSTDTPTFSLYYSFFLISLENLQEEQGVIFRIPALRDRLDDIESAVKYFVSVLTNVNQDDSFGTFVITASNGSRYFAVWRASQTYLFIGVSCFSISSDSHSVFVCLFASRSLSFPCSPSPEDSLHSLDLSQKKQFLRFFSPFASIQSSVHLP